MYQLFRDVAGPYQRTLWVKYVLYTHIIAHLLSKIIGNYHRIFTHEQPNMSTFNAEFIDPSQLSLPVHQLPYLQNEIFYQNSSYFTLRRLPVPWQQYYVPLCVVPSGLYSRYTCCGTRIAYALSDWNGVALCIVRSGQVNRVYHTNYLIRLVTTRRVMNRFAPLEVIRRIRIHPSGGGGSHDCFFARIATWDRQY